MLLLAAHEVAVERMTLGDFVLVNAFMMQIFLPLNFLGFVYREIKSSMANIEKMFDLLKTDAKVKDQENAKALKVSEGKIEFKDVSFAYDEERPILKNFSFSLEAGEKIAIVGSSGAGKSTLAKLVFRFYDVTQGQILIDGQSIKAITQHSLRQAIGVVPQDSVLFNDTLIENVRYGRPDASDDDVKSAIKMAHLQEFI
jgi:ATP-binding cassette subfamily B protein